MRAYINEAVCSKIMALKKIKGEGELLEFRDVETQRPNVMCMDPVNYGFKLKGIFETIVVMVMM